MQLIRCLLSNFYLNMFRASLCPSSGDQDRVLLHMVSALVVLAVVVCSWVVSCVHCVKVTSRTVTFTQCTQFTTQLHTTTASTTSADTICSSTRSCSPDDGHNDARNMLRKKFDNKHRISCILLIFLSPLLGHTIKHCTVLTRGPHRMLFSAS